MRVNRDRTPKKGIKDSSQAVLILSGEESFFVVPGRM